MGILQRASCLPLFLAIAGAFSGCVSPGQNAAAGCDTAHLQEVLRQPNHGNEDLNKLFWWAGIHGCVEWSQMLLKAGAKLTDSENLLGNAAVTGNSQMARLLVE